MEVMIDIETLGLKPGSVILSIGAVSFNPYVANSIKETFYSEISISSCLQAGLSIGPETLVWWGKQSTRLNIQKLERVGNTIAEALSYLSSFLIHVGPSGIWANDPDFDMSLLLAAYDITGLPLVARALDFRKFRSVRTVKAMATRFKLRPFIWDESLPSHHALSDATNQANQISHYLSQLQGKL